MGRANTVRKRGMKNPAGGAAGFIELLKTEISAQIGGNADTVFYGADQARVGA